MSKTRAFRVNAKGSEDTELIIYQCERLCGKGNFSSVFQAQLIKPEQRAVAIKNIWNTLNKQTRRADDEIEILTQIQHENIASLLYYFSKRVDEDWIISLVLEYLPNTMMCYRDRRNYFNKIDIQLYSWQIFTALSYLHAKSIVHMDLKPSNIVLDHKVTRYYRPPELLFGSISFTCAIDLWSVACVIYEIITNRILFKESTTEKQIELITDIFGYPTIEDIRNMKISRPRIARRDGRGIDLFIANSVSADELLFLKTFLFLDPLRRAFASAALDNEFFRYLIENYDNPDITVRIIPDFVKVQLEIKKNEKK